MCAVISALLGSRDAGVQLNLVDCRADCGFGYEPIKLGRREVGHADRPHLAGRDQLLERLLGRNIRVALRQWPVDQEQINVVQVKLTQARIETGNRTIVSLKLAIQLGGDKHLLAR